MATAGPKPEDKGKKLEAALGKDDIVVEIDPDILAGTVQDILGRARSIEGEMRILKNESMLLNQEIKGMKEKIKENQEKVKMNKQLPYLVAHIVEVIHRAYLIHYYCLLPCRAEGANADLGLASPRSFLLVPSLSLLFLRCPVRSSVFHF